MIENSPLETPASKPVVLPHSRIPAIVGWMAAVVIALLAVAATCTLVPWGLVGLLRDDGIYLLGARALRAGLGYIDLSLPNHPGVLRYPPGFSLLLASVTLGVSELHTELMRAQWVGPASAFVSVLLTYRFLERWSTFPTLLRIATTAWCAFQPMFLLISARVLADVPFGAIGLAIALVFETVWASAAASLGAWLGIGLLVGGACLFRYAGIALVASASAVLVMDRRWRPLCAFGLGVAVMVLPWLLYRQHIGGSDYVEGYTTLLPHNVAGYIRAVGLVAAGFLASGLPGMLCGAFFPAIGPLSPTPFTFLLGLFVSSIVIAGATAGIARPLGERSRLVECYVLATFGMGAVYALGFTWYADSFLQRTFLPILPFIAMSAIRGVQVLVAWLPGQARNGVLWFAVIAGMAANGLGALTYLVTFPPNVNYLHSYQALYAEIVKVVPKDAVMIGFEGHMITLNTDRQCHSFPQFAEAPGKDPLIAPPRLAIRYMVKHKPRYVVGTPDYGVADGHDRTIELINGVLKYAPGLLTQVYMGPKHNFALFEVDPALLEKARVLFEEFDKARHAPGRK